MRNNRHGVSGQQARLARFRPVWGGLGIDRPRECRRSEFKRLLNGVEHGICGTRSPAGRVLASQGRFSGLTAENAARTIRPLPNNRQSGFEARRITQRRTCAHRPMPAHFYFPAFDGQIASQFMAAVRGSRKARRFPLCPALRTARRPPPRFEAGMADSTTQRSPS